MSAEPEEDDLGGQVVGATGLIEVAEIEPVAIEGSHLVRLPCGDCGRPGAAVVAPGQERNAYCGACRRARALASAKITGLPGVAPPPGVGTSEIASQRVACPVCCETKVKKTCTFTGHVPPVAPEMVCRPGLCGHDPLGPVLDLYSFARSHNWQAVVQHSRGRVMGLTGKQLAAADMWSVRFRRGTWQGYATRRGEAWDSVCVTGAGLPPFLGLGVTGLRAWLADPEKPPAWYEAVREHLAEQDLARKVVKCPGPGLCAWVDGQRGDHTHRANGDIKIKTSRKERASGN